MAHCLSMFRLFTCLFRKNTRVSFSAKQFQFSINKIYRPQIEKPLNIEASNLDPVKDFFLK